MALSLQRYTYTYGGTTYGDLNAPLYLLLKHRLRIEREKATVTSISTMNGERLPEHLLIEILSWLPAKDVLRYKSVCKSWYAVISSPAFISKHLQNNRNYNPNCMLALYYCTPNEVQLFELFVDETPRVLEHEVLYDIPAYNTFMCGPCDGLYYLCDCSFRAFWNPTINELTTLPPIITKPNPPTDAEYRSEDTYAFGIDPLTRDYKVVVIKEYWPVNEGQEVSYPQSVLVYSVRTNSWKYCGDLTGSYDFENNKCFIQVNGCCFCLGKSYYYDPIYRELIISFDMSSDSYLEMPVPNYQRPNYKPAKNGLGMYEDSLAFFSVHSDEVDGILDIWIFDCGIWAKKFTVGPIPEPLRPIGHWDNNKVLVECSGEIRMKLLLCDPNSQEIKDLGFEEVSCAGIFPLMETLVSTKRHN